MNFLKKIAKKHQVKLIGQKLISFLPGQAGFLLNEKIVRKMQGSLADSYDIETRIWKGVNNFKLLKENTNFEFNNANILELGTGWHAIDLCLFWILGSNKLFTVDHHRHLDFDYIILVLKTFLKDDVILKLKQTNLSSEKTITSRLALLNKQIEKLKTVEDILEMLNAKFYKSKSCMTTNLPISKEVDLFYSESVIHRIPIKALTENIKYISTHILADTACSFQRTDQRDINNRGRIDTQLWHLKYLKYSDFVYNNLICSRFNYQNRWRESDFIKLLEKNGLKTIFKKSFTEKEDVEKMKKFKVHKKFTHYTLQDLATSASIIISKKEQ